MSDPGAHRDLVVVGALLRRKFRTFLDLQGVTWQERKGVTTSDFIVTASAGQWRIINTWITQVKAVLSE